MTLVTATYWQGKTRGFFWQFSQTQLNHQYSFIVYPFATLPHPRCSTHSHSEMNESHSIYFFFLSGQIGQNHHYFHQVHSYATHLRHKPTPLLHGWITHSCYFSSLICFCLLQHLGGKKDVTHKLIYTTSGDLRQSFTTSKSIVHSVSSPGLKNGKNIIKEEVGGVQRSGTIFQWCHDTYTHYSCTGKRLKKENSPEHLRGEKIQTTTTKVAQSVSKDIIKNVNTATQENK